MVDAATHHPAPRPLLGLLQRNGADVTVLEARGRVGGRVHSFQAGGFTAPVDLGTPAAALAGAVGAVVLVLLAPATGDGGAPLWSCSPSAKSSQPFPML